jgi:hypothetical protein
MDSSVMYISNRTEENFHQEARNNKIDSERDSFIIYVLIKIEKNFYFSIPFYLNASLHRFYSFHKFHKFSFALRIREN